jgi:hypothetical protein
MIAIACESLCGAKGVFDPDDPVFAGRDSFHSEHIEAHRAGAPRRLPLQEISRGANDLALFAPRDRGRCSAEIGASALPHFDDCQHAVIEAYQIEFTAPAA